MKDLVKQELNRTYFPKLIMQVSAQEFKLSTNLNGTKRTQTENAGISDDVNTGHISDAPMFSSPRNVLQVFV